MLAGASPAPLAGYSAAFSGAAGLADSSLAGFGFGFRTGVSAGFVTAAGVVAAEPSAAAVPVVAAAVVLAGMGAGAPRGAGTACDFELGVSAGGDPAGGIGAIGGMGCAAVELASPAAGAGTAAGGGALGAMLTGGAGATSASWAGAGAASGAFAGAGADTMPPGLGREGAGGAEAMNHQAPPATAPAATRPNTIHTLRLGPSSGSGRTARDIPRTSPAPAWRFSRSFNT